jgi:hypothetical protein
MSCFPRARQKAPARWQVWLNLPVAYKFQCKKGLGETGVFPSFLLSAGDAKHRCLNKMLIERLRHKKTEIVKKWFDTILESYPPDSINFFSRIEKRFGNPVGYTIHQEIESLCDMVLANGKGDDEQKAISLDNIIKIRTVQDFTASQAVKFIFLLKKIIREYRDPNDLSEQALTELLEVESRIDRLALEAFDTYMRCRDIISEIKVNESKRKISKLMERINSTPGFFKQAEDQHHDEK